MELKDFLNILKRQWTTVLLSTVTLLLLWFLFSMFNEKHYYRASAKAITTPSVMQLSQFIGIDVGRFINPAVYTDLPRSHKVLQRAQEYLSSPDLIPPSDSNLVTIHAYPGIKVEEIDESIAVESKEQKYLFTISARSDVPQKAIDIANAVAIALKRQLREYSTEHIKKVINIKSQERDIRKLQWNKEQVKLDEVARAEGMTEAITREDANRLHSRMDNLERERILLEGQIKGIDGRIESSEQRKKEIASDEFVPEVEIPPTETYRDLQVKLSQLQIQLIENRIRYTEVHPAIRDIHNRDTYYRDLLAKELKKMEESRPVYVRKHKQELLKQNEKYMEGLKEEKISRTNEMENIKQHLADLTVRREKYRRYLIQKDEVDKVAAVIADYDAKITEWSDKENAMPNLIEVENPARTASSEGKRSERMLPMMAALAVILGISIGFLRDYLDDRIRTSIDIKKYLNWPVIGVVPLVKQKNEVVLHQSAIKSPLMDIYSRISILMDNLTQKKGGRVYMLTSTKPQEGKTTIASNLAIATARMGKKVVLVDCDLRHPSIHKTFHIENSVGVSTFLSGKLEARSELQKISELPIVVVDSEQPVAEPADDERRRPAEEDQPSPVPNGGLSDIVVEGEIEGLYLVPCGPSPANPLSLLESPNFKTMVDRLRERFDTVILDTPPLESTTDPLVVARHADSTVMVVSCWDTKKYELTWGKRTLMDIGANVIGVILNRSTMPSRGYYYYYYDHKSQTERV